MTLILVLVLLVEIPASMWAAWSLSRRYRYRLVESLFFRRLVERNLRVAYVAGGLIGAIVLYSLMAYMLGWQPIPRPWGTVALAIALIVLLAGPILDEIEVRRVAKADRR